MALLDKPNMEEVWASGGAAVKPSDEKIQTGWTAEVPPYQYENWIQGRQDQYLAHVNQRGIPQWDGSTEYEGGGLSYTQGTDGVVYRSVLPSGTSGTAQDPTTDSGGTYWEKAFADNGDSRIVNAAPTLRENIKVTVGAGGDFPTINEAVLHLSRFTPDLGVTAEVELMSGFVMSEQLLVEGLNLGWITITGVDSETVINEPSLTRTFTSVRFSGGVELRKPAFGIINGTLPTIGQLFSFSSKGSVDDYRSGVLAYNLGKANILDGCGVKNAGFRGIEAGQCSTINAEGADVSGAGENGIVAWRGSTVNAFGANASGAGGAGISATSGSTINAEDADVSGAGGAGIYTAGGSTIHAFGVNASGAGGDGFYVSYGSTVTAFGATGTLFQAANTVTAHGIIFQP